MDKYERKMLREEEKKYDNNTKGFKNILGNFVQFTSDKKIPEVNEDDFAELTEEEILIKQMHEHTLQILDNLSNIPVLNRKYNNDSKILEQWGKWAFEENTMLPKEIIIEQFTAVIQLPTILEE